MRPSWSILCRSPTALSSLAFRGPPPAPAATLKPVLGSWRRCPNVGEHSPTDLTSLSGHHHQQAISTHPVVPSRPSCGCRMFRNDGIPTAPSHLRHGQQCNPCCFGRRPFFFLCFPLNRPWRTLMCPDVLYMLRSILLIISLGRDFWHDQVQKWEVSCRGPCPSLALTWVAQDSPGRSAGLGEWSENDLPFSDQSRAD